MDTPLVFCEKNIAERVLPGGGERGGEGGGVMGVMQQAHGIGAGPRFLVVRE